MQQAVILKKIAAGQITVISFDRLRSAHSVVAGIGCAGDGCQQQSRNDLHHVVQSCEGEILLWYGGCLVNAEGEGHVCRAAERSGARERMYLVR